MAISLWVTPIDIVDLFNDFDAFVKNQETRIKAVSSWWTVQQWLQQELVDEATRVLKVAEWYINGSTQELNGLDPSATDYSSDKVLLTNIQTNSNNLRDAAQQVISKYPTITPTSTVCENGVTDDTGECLVNDQGTAGIYLNEKCLLNWSCKFKIYETLGIRESNQSTEPSIFVQDIILSATSFIGTVVTISLVVSAIKYIWGWAREWSATQAKTGIIYAIVWLLLVSLSYTIIRLVQYLAQG